MNLTKQLNLTEQQMQSMSQRLLNTQNNKETRNNAYIQGQTMQLITAVHAKASLDPILQFHTSTQLMGT